MIKNSNLKNPPMLEGYLYDYEEAIKNLKEAEEVKQLIDEIKRRLDNV